MVTLSKTLTYNIQSPLATVKAFIDKHKLIKEHDTVVVGLSGGPDSVFLVHALSFLAPEYKLKLVAAHLNHGWRPDAMNDQALSETTANALAIPFFAGKADSYICPDDPRATKEEEGRRLRRRFLESVACQHDAQSIALGHHKNDQMETFFMRLMRGASLTGLTGIKPKAGLYIRPNLGLFKAEILAYLDEQKISYVLDPTNESIDYVRNRIRLDVIPALENADSRFTKTFFSSLEKLNEADTFLEKLTHHTFQSLHKERSLNLNEFKSLHSFMQKRVLLHWLCVEKVSFTPTHAFLSEALRFLCSARGGKHALSPTWAILKKGSHAWITHS